MSIPIDPDGYSVNVDTGTIHTRYATHAPGIRTRTVKGVHTLLGDMDGKPCKTCYPSPAYETAERPKTQQTRRSSPDA